MPGTCPAHLNIDHPKNSWQKYLDELCSSSSNNFSTSLLLFISGPKYFSQRVWQQISLIGALLLRWETKFHIHKNGLLLTTGATTKVTSWKRYECVAECTGAYISHATASCQSRWVSNYSFMTCYIDLCSAGNGMNIKSVGAYTTVSQFNLATEIFVLEISLRNL
jgi:hypothetical protein